MMQAVPVHANHSTVSNLFTVMLPELESRAGAIASRYRDREKAASEALSFMFLMFVAALQKGKILQPAALAWVAVHFLRHRSEQAPFPDRPSRCVNMDLQDSRATESLGGSLATDEHESPLERTRLKLDWTAFSNTQPRRMQLVLLRLAHGHRKNEIAKELGVSPGRLTQLLDRLAVDAGMFFETETEAPLKALSSC